MRALRDLRELQRVAEQHDVARRRTHRERVGQRHLARLVDNKCIDRAVERFDWQRATPCRQRAVCRRLASAKASIRSALLTEALS